MKQFLFVSVIFFVGCATVSKDECVKFNWKQQGFKGAMRGEILSDTNEYYHNKCTIQHGVVINGEQLKSGYEQGLKRYCTPQNALELGLSGREYEGICPIKMEKKFLSQFKDGSNSFLKSRVKSLESDIDDKDDEINNLKDKISDLEDRISELESR